MRCVQHLVTLTTLVHDLEAVDDSALVQEVVEVMQRAGSLSKAVTQDGSSLLHWCASQSKALPVGTNPLDM